MEVILAKTAGFCFGVKRAVEMVYENVSKDNVYTYGPIIHNEEVVKDLQNKGVKVLASEDDLLENPSGTVVIRAHGITEETYTTVHNAGHELVDATCPFVLKIHKIVREAYDRGDFVVIIGDKNHPEVVGIKSCAPRNSEVIADESEAKKLLKSLGNEPKNLCIVSQTTYNYKKFQEIVEIFEKNSYHRCDILNTICNATQERQQEAAFIAGRVDAMIVIGDRTSSNSQKLYDICSRICNRTYFIQTADDMDYSLLCGLDKVGITAGASTPKNIIEEVQTRCQI
ncbi:MAG: 4-hydroxy-3-methylbut-2-enyl diphosphate reductase [Butyrivibrio sp.]